MSQPNGSNATGPEECALCPKIVENTVTSRCCESCCRRACNQCWLACSMCGDEVCSDCSAECSECNLELCVPCKEAGVCCSPHMITPVEGCSNGHDYTDDWGSENSDTESQ